MADQIVLTSEQWGELREQMGELRSDVKAIRTDVKAIREVTTDHEKRIRQVEDMQAKQAGLAGFAKWFLPYLVALGAFLLSFLAFLKRAI